LLGYSFLFLVYSYNPKKELTINLLLLFIFSKLKAKPKSKGDKCKIKNETCVHPILPYISVFKKGYIMHRFKFFAIWNMVFTKKNRRPDIFVKSESSVLVTIIFLMIQ